MVLAGGGVLVVLGALVFGRGVLRHAPPAVALAAARGPTSAREARDDAAPAMPAVPSVAAIDVVPPESAAVGRN
jgi:hypothetical protein